MLSRVLHLIRIRGRAWLFVGKVGLGLGLELGLELSKG
jgi:hypothetical protein